MQRVAGAEPVFSVEGNMYGAVMQGAVALPGRRPHHGRKDRVGTWETSSGPQSL